MEKYVCGVKLKILFKMTTVGAVTALSPGNFLRDLVKISFMERINLLNRTTVINVNPINKKSSKEKDTYYSANVLT
jgi:hypothetical protein